MQQITATEEFAAQDAQICIAANDERTSVAAE
jgi:hypothetical protein